MRNTNIVEQNIRPSSACQDHWNLDRISKKKKLVEKGGILYFEYLTVFFLTFQKTRHLRSSDLQITGGTNRDFFRCQMIW